MLHIFNQSSQLRERIETLKKEGQVIGLVPTMGALHSGHLSLIENALNRCEIVVVSIFVNPTQFNNQKDLETYPRTLEEDITLLRSFKKDNIIIFAPSVNDIYGNRLQSESFKFDGLENVMEGAHRSGHFDGVGTIVKRLFEIVTPNYAYFGEKDYQQLLIIKTLVKNYDLSVKIIGCPIFREPDGLAMSSRNTRLSKSHRAASPFIYEILKSARLKFGTKSAKQVLEWVEKQFLNHELLELEYFIIADSETLKPLKRKSKKRSYRAFIAVYADDVRLIDNIALN